MRARRTLRRVDPRLLKVLSAAERARDIEDQVCTDRDGELLPDEPEYEAELEEMPAVELARRIPT